MDEETYAAIPATLSVRELRVHVAIRGFRVRQLIVVTTLIDADRYPKEEIAALFRQRWHAELDLRNIKISLQMDDVRGKTPEMVRREIWAHWLAYNLIRKTMAQAVLVHGKLPRQVSFASALAAIATSWDHATVACTVCSLHWPRPNSAWSPRTKKETVPIGVEPRAVKRRPKPHPLLKEPRAECVHTLGEKRRNASTRSTAERFSDFVRDG